MYVLIVPSVDGHGVSLTGLSYGDLERLHRGQTLPVEEDNIFSNYPIYLFIALASNANFYAWPLCLDLLITGSWGGGRRLT